MGGLVNVVSGWQQIPQFNTIREEVRACGCQYLLDNTTEMIRIKNQSHAYEQN
jgi:hypothetical protein